MALSSRAVMMNIANAAKNTSHILYRFSARPEHFLSNSGTQFQLFQTNGNTPDTYQRWASRSESTAAGGARGYFDGTAAGQDTTVINPTDISLFYLGHEHQPRAWWNGAIGDIRYYTDGKPDTAAAGVISLEALTDDTYEEGAVE